MSDKTIFWILVVLMVLNIVFAIFGPFSTFNTACAVFIMAVLGADLYGGKTYGTAQ